MTKIVDLEAVLVSVPAEENAFTETPSEDMLVVLPGLGLELNWDLVNQFRRNW